MTIKEEFEIWWREKYGITAVSGITMCGFAYESCAKGESVQALVNKVKDMDCECGGETGSEESYKDGTCLRCEALKAWELATK